MSYVLHPVLKAKHEADALRRSQPVALNINELMRFPSRPFRTVPRVCLTELFQKIPWQPAADAGRGASTCVHAFCPRALLRG